MKKILIILIIFLLASCSILKQQKTEEYIPEKTTPSIQQKTVKMKHIEKNAISKEDLSPQFLKNERSNENQFKKKIGNYKETAINFLLIGSDTRGEKVSRSDSIMIAQYNPTNRSVKIVSLMRDCYVKIPNYSKGSNKLNYAYFLGGSDLLKETIERNFNIKIDHTVLIDFQGFVNIIDLLAPEGISVYVTEEIIEDRNLNMKPGDRTLHGNELLAYVRFRHDAQSDFGRVKRQQEVITKLKDTLQNRLLTFEGIRKIPRLVSDTFKYIETDMSLDKMLFLSSRMVLSPAEKIDTLRIPVQNGYVNARFEHSGAVLQLDIPKNQQAIQEFFELSENKKD